MTSLKAETPALPVVAENSNAIAPMTLPLAMTWRLLAVLQSRVQVGNARAWKLCEQQLKVSWKQLAGQECLIGAVEMLTDALVHLGLVGRLAHGKAGASGSMWKGKGKGRADVGVSLEMSNEDADGEKDSSEDGEEGDD